MRIETMAYSSCGSAEEYKRYENTDEDIKKCKPQHAHSEQPCHSAETNDSGSRNKRRSVA
jgi:hypothetical protein